MTTAGRQGTAVARIGRPRRLLQVAAPPEVEPLATDEPVEASSEPAPEVTAEGSSRD